MLGFIFVVVYKIPSFVSPGMLSTGSRMQKIISNTAIKLDLSSCLFYFAVYDYFLSS